MLFALLYLFLWLVLFPVTILVIFVIAALCGYPRRIGRRVYAISIVPLALLSHGLYKYIRPGGCYDPRESAFSLLVSFGRRIRCVRRDDWLLARRVSVP
jgi:hypothetical protein